MRKFFKTKNWARIWKRFGAKEKIRLGIFFVLIIFAASWIVRDFYRSQTSEISASGGGYVEAVSESPHSINPLLATNDADRDLSRLIFSSLLKYDTGGGLAPDLAAGYAVSKDGKIYTIKLKDGVYWQDGEPFGADDVLFTINAVQNPATNSPLRNSWTGVKAESPEKNTIVLTLKSPYGGFAENLAMLGIIPRHIWSKVSPQNFPLADFNLKPVGTGPYKFVKLQKDSLGRIISANLAANDKYFAPAPLIKNISFKFYQSEEEAISAFNRKEADGILLQTAQNENQIRGLADSSVFRLASPRVYALFINTNDPILKDKSVRLALNYAIDKNSLFKKLISGEGKIAVGPIPPGESGSAPDLSGYDFDSQKAGSMLEHAGWTKNESGVYAKKLDKKDKESSPLKFSLITIQSMQIAAEMISNDLKNAGIEADVKVVSLGDLQQNYIKTKNYGTVLIGESYTAFADPYAFWSGAAIKDAGLNLSFYTNNKADGILAAARKISDPVKRAKQLEEFQKLVLADAPAAFLYSPDYIYIVKNNIRNINLKGMLIVSSNRFAGIVNWYAQTERIWK